MTYAILDTTLAASLVAACTGPASATVQDAPKTCVSKVRIHEEHANVLRWPDPGEAILPRRDALVRKTDTPGLRRAAGRALLMSKDRSEIVDDV
jgi:hypothetical protein